MKDFKLKLLFVCAAVLFIVAPVTLADWNPGDPNKWVQLPDLTPTGIDIAIDNRGTLQRTAGDDFPCTMTGPITDVHLWVSWLNDVNGVISSIILRIYSNDPIGPGGFSQPDELLWSMGFTRFQFTQRLYYTMPSPQKEGWWDPQSGGYIPNADAKIWQLNFNIDPNAAFVQQEGNIYWLVVEAKLSPGTTRLGWKTRDLINDGHFMDDAVWRNSPTGSWFEMRYPSGHPYYTESIDMAFVITTQQQPHGLDFGDAPEAALAYPVECVQGAFPTCMNTGPAGWIQHTNFGAYFGPMVDFELEGNAGNCPVFTPNTYDQDECFQDGDGGLLYPTAFTITGPVGSEVVVPCSMPPTTPLGTVCDTAVWGLNLDIDVHNHMPSNAIGYVNVLADWNKDGQWAGALSGCTTGAAPEHVLVNFQVPNPYDGPLSALFPPNFLIGPYPGHIWTRFTITERPVPEPWDGSGNFEDGESEDYLLYVNPIEKPNDCDWNQGDDHKMHWPQTPDLEPTGIDVDMSSTPLADDFMCSKTGWITDIHFWASYPHDCLPPQGVAGLTFQMSICSNLPPDQNIPWSRPGEVLWTRTFVPCTYTVRQITDSSIEGWYDPVTQLYNPADHNQCYQYNFCIKPEEAFLQEEGTIYWLEIKDIPPDPPNYTFGWKTTSYGLRWNDDAVFWYSPVGVWAPLTYPLGHPYEYLSLDLAFVITGEELPPVVLKPLIEHSKWSQPPIEIDPASRIPEYSGWDEKSFREDAMGMFPCWDIPRQCHGDADGLMEGTPKTGYYYVGNNDMAILLAAWGGVYPNPPYNHCADFNRDFVIDNADQTILNTWYMIKEWPDGPNVPPDCPSEGDHEVWNLVADDFRCLGEMPVTSIHWWGSYYGWEDAGGMPPQLPIGWKICFWSNIPANPAGDPNYSYPEVLLWQIDVDANRLEVNEVGTDSYHGYYPEDICYQYTLQLEPNEWFWQGDFEPNTIDNVFWLSIAAGYDPCVAHPDYPWGWKTRPWSWMDDAVRFPVGSIEPGMVLNPHSLTPIKDPIYHESMDVAFELDTDPNYIKWEQHYTGIRDWPHYEDELSMATVETVVEPIIKWHQEPDLSPNGIDVDATWDLLGSYPPQILADDFKCIKTGPITDIHIWGSWWYDMLPMGDPTQVIFTLSIHKDVPVGDPCNPFPYSIPGQVLWLQYFHPGQFTVELAGEAQESYYIPCSGIFTPYDHYMVWKYNFDINEAEAFIQHGDPCNPVVYWLDVQAIPMDEISTDVRFGWKTAVPPPWNDDAVWTVGQEPYNGPWEELHHPMTGESLDLAFAITGQKTHEEFVLKRRVADDWKCEHKFPVTAIVWWGSYIDYLFQPCSGQFMPLPVKPDYFDLMIWSDVPANPSDPCSFSHPGDVVWQYRANNYDEVLVGYDKHPEVPIPGQPGRETVFRYSVQIDDPNNWFYQKDVNNIYWLSVVAVYDVNSPNYDWGWTNHKHVFNDDAAAWEQDLTGLWHWVPLEDQTGETEDMSFILFTVPECFPRCHPDYNTWVAVGEPNCWCCPRQCHGDADCTKEYIVKKGYYYVHFKDLSVLLAAWNVREPPQGPGMNWPDPNICADFDHDKEYIVKKGYYRVHFKDLSILLANWNVREPPQGLGIDPNCLDCP